MRHIVMKAVSIVLVSLIAAPVIQAGVDIRVDRDKRFDLASVRTWRWAADGPGEVKMLLTPDDDPEVVRRRFEPVIVEAVNTEMIRRGYVQAPDPDTDVTLRYYVLISAGTSAQQMGQFLPATAQWGIPPFQPQTTSLRVMEKGSLVIDLSSPSLGQVIWRGVAEAEVDRQKTDAQRDKRVRDAIRDLIAKLPKR